MSVTYTGNPDGSTTALVSANEGTLASLAAGNSASFTFDLPDGDWTAFALNLFVEGGEFPTAYTSYDNYGFASLFEGYTIVSEAAVGPQDVTLSRVSGPGTYPNAPTTFSFNDLLSEAIYEFGESPAPASDIGQVQGYAVLGYLTDGAQVTLTVSLPLSDPSNPAVVYNNSQAVLQGLSPIFGLLSIVPTPPAEGSTSQNTSATDTDGADLLPYTGSATVVILPPSEQQQDQYLPQGNGYQPLTYFWTVLDPLGNAPDTLTGQGTDTVTWSYAYAGGNVPVSGILRGDQYTLITALCRVTNGLYPHQVGEPLFGYVSGGGGVYGRAHPPQTVASYALGEDAHRRPLAVSPSSVNSPGLTGLFSQDAGHSFLPAVIDSRMGADNPSLLVQPQSNHYRVVYSLRNGTTPQLMLATGLLDDHYTPVSGSPAVIASLSGTFPVAAQHPTDADYALLVYSDGGSLKTASSLDGGANWAPLSVIASGVDLSSVGRPALCWLGNTAFVVYGNGNSLVCVASADRGQTWAAPVTVASSGPYSGLSMTGWQGQLALLAFSGTPAAPVLLTSQTLGQSWQPGAGSLPNIRPPSGLGVLRESGQYRLGVTHHSPDSGMTWLAN